MRFWINQGKVLVAKFLNMFINFIFIWIYSTPGAPGFTGPKGDAGKFQFFIEF